MFLAGIDLAWNSKRNSTALAISEFKSKRLNVIGVHDDIRSLDTLESKIKDFDLLRGIAIDAPLIVRNNEGQRDCERQIGQVYGSRKASCHTSNLKRNRNPDGVKFSKKLAELGFHHINGNQDKWQLECYPHPAIIEIFALPERHSYKKGRVPQRRNGQTRLAKMIQNISASTVLRLSFNQEMKDRFDSKFIYSLKGKTLKRNEDFLDAILCLYIAGLYAIGVREKTYGDLQTGYIYVPQKKCV